MEEIEAFAHLVGGTKNSFFRLGYGFTRGRGGTVSMHAALSVPAVTGAWQVRGGGAMHSNSDIFRLDKSRIEGRRYADPSIRHLDQSRIGAVLTGDPAALNGGPPVTAMLIQNTNPANVAPEQDLVRRGFMRDDLFTVVHEQFMTDTAELADIVLPATMFLEHDDIYRGGGHTHIIPGPKLIDPPEGPKPNHYVIEELARRLGVGDLDGFGQTERELLTDMTERSGIGSYDALVEERWQDRAVAFEEAHFLNGFGHADRLFHFDPDWTEIRSGTRPADSLGLQGPVEALPALPDHPGSVAGERGRGAPLPAGHRAGPKLPQLVLCRDANVTDEGGPADGHAERASTRPVWASSRATASRSPTVAARSFFTPRSRRRQWPERSSPKAYGRTGRTKTDAASIR